MTNQKELPKHTLTRIDASKTHHHAILLRPKIQKPSPSLLSIDLSETAQHRRTTNATPETTSTVQELRSELRDDRNSQEGKRVPRPGTLTLFSSDVYKVVDVWLACEPQFGGDAGGDEPAIGCGGARLGHRARVYFIFFRMAGVRSFGGNESSSRRQTLPATEMRALVQRVRHLGFHVGCTGWDCAVSISRVGSLHRSTVQTSVDEKQLSSYQ